MAYQKQNFENNATVLTAEHLNHIEEGIVSNEKAIEEIELTEGKSAYDIWLEAGNEGTEEDFLESLNGEDGISVTITKKETTTESGGVNKIYFSNDEILGIRNGYDGKDGKDGVAPSIEVEQHTDGVSLTVDDENYFIRHGMDGSDGSDGANGKDGSNGVDGKDGKDGISVTHSWNGTTLTVTSASGTSSANLKGDKGDRGEQGTQGIPGDKGDKGDKGDPYTLTENDKNDIAGRASQLVDVPDVDLTPYIKKDEVYDYTENPKFTNVFDDVEITYGKRLNNDGSVSDIDANLATTGFIKCKVNQIIRVNEDFPLDTSGGTKSIVMYDASYNMVHAAGLATITTSSYFFEVLETFADGNIKAFKFIRPANTEYIRISNYSPLVGKNPVMTIDEPIEYEMGYGTKLNEKVKVDYGQIINPPQKNCWSILPNEHINISYSEVRLNGKTVKPINTLEHFVHIAENYGYNTMKCDVRPTSDGELVLCHDAGFTFDSNGKITNYDSNNQTLIHDVTAETCLGYTHTTGEHPCLVGDYLKVCRKYGKVAFITIRNEYMDVVIPKLIEELKKHNMIYSTIINSMSYTSLVTWREHDADVMINYTLSYEMNVDKAAIDKAIALGYCSLCGFGLSSASTVPSTTCDFDYARANGIRLLQAIAYKDGTAEDCYALGFDGCQIGYAWNPKENVRDLISSAVGDAIGGSY